MDLSDLFSQFGPLVEVALLTTPEGKSKGAAFVTFVNRIDAERALNELQGYCFPNSSRGINISFATKQGRPGAIPPVTVPAKAFQGSPVSSAATHATFTVGEEPSTPPGFAPVMDKRPAQTGFSSEEILKYITETHRPSADSAPYSILRRSSEDHLKEMEEINRDLLSSIFGETRH
jgi:hypothetical protein